MNLRPSHGAGLTAAALLFALLPGCGSEDKETAGQTVDAAAPSAPVDAAAQCQPQACSCGAGSGIQRCNTSGQLGSCECAPGVTPDAGIVIVGVCPTGRYAGNFKGTAGFIITTADVSGLDFFNDQPPLQITLSPPTGGNEFVVMGDGLMRGNANGTFPFEATIHGNLDCNTKQFKATLSGSVQLFLEGIKNDFTGTMVSSYDTGTHTFTNGMWTVTGNGADGGADFGLTGNGSWTAEHVTDAGRDAGVDGGP